MDVPIHLRAWLPSGCKEQSLGVVVVRIAQLKFLLRVLNSTDS